MPEVLLSIRQIPAHAWCSTRWGARGGAHFVINTRNAGPGPLQPRHAAHRLGVRVLLVTMGATAPIPPTRSAHELGGGSMARRKLHTVLCRVGFKIVKRGPHPVHFPHQPTHIGA